MSKVILTDVDETILEFAKPFQDWMEKEKGFKSDVQLRDHYKIEEWLGVDRAEAINLMSEFGKADVSYLNRTESDAGRILPLLHAEGWQFVGITACGLDSEYAARRTKIIADTFGFMFQGIHFVDYRASKLSILESFKPTIWVEDNLAHAIDGAKAGHTAFLLDRKYNQTPEPDPAHAIRVRLWWEIYNGITDRDRIEWFEPAGLWRGIVPLMEGFNA